MVNENVEEILVPKNDDDSWPVIITNNGWYSLKMGGFEKTEKNSIDQSNYHRCNFPFKDRLICGIYTDEAYVYYRLRDGNVIVSGWTDFMMDDDLTLLFGVSFRGTEIYDDDFFATGLYQLSMDALGNSVIEKNEVNPGKNQRKG